MIKNNKAKLAMPHASKRKKSADPGSSFVFSLPGSSEGGLGLNLQLDDDDDEPESEEEDPKDLSKLYIFSLSSF